MDVDELVHRYPTIFHTAPREAWPSIQRHGLLSTRRLVELYDVGPAARDAILTRRRSRPVPLEAPGLPPALVRDQRPLKFFEERVAVEDRAGFLEAVNARVFFWATRERLERLRNARDYRARPQLVLQVDTARLLERHGDRVELCRLNSGAITQLSHPVRSRRDWVPLAAYPYAEHHTRYGRAGALAEVTVLDAVPDVLELTRAVDLGPAD